MIEKRKTPIAEGLRSTKATRKLFLRIMLSLTLSYRIYLGRDRFLIMAITFHPMNQRSFLHELKFFNVVVLLYFNDIGSGFHFAEIDDHFSLGQDRDRHEVAIGIVDFDHGFFEFPVDFKNKEVRAFGRDRFRGLLLISGSSESGSRGQEEYQG